MQIKHFLHPSGGYPAVHHVYRLPFSEIQPFILLQEHNNRAQVQDLPAIVRATVHNPRRETS